VWQAKKDWSKTASRLPADVPHPGGYAKQCIATAIFAAMWDEWSYTEDRGEHKQFDKREWGRVGTLLLQLQEDVRTGVVASVWNKTKDAELPSGNYVFAVALSAWHDRGIAHHNALLSDAWGPQHMGPVWEAIGVEVAPDRGGLSKNFKTVRSHLRGNQAREAADQSRSTGGR